MQLLYKSRSYTNLNEEILSEESIRLKFDNKSSR